VCRALEGAFLGSEDDPLIQVEPVCDLAALDIRDSDAPCFDAS
jgi:hypothetical protein